MSNQAKITPASIEASADAFKADKGLYPSGTSGPIQHGPLSGLINSATQEEATWSEVSWAICVSAGGSLAICAPYHDIETYLFHRDTEISQVDDPSNGTDWIAKNCIDGENYKTHFSMGVVEISPQKRGQEGPKPSV